MFNEFYKCEKCGVMVEVLKGPGRKMLCCNKSMQIMIPNTIDASFEKHIPVIEYTDTGVLVRVGSDPHPMVEAHYIEWIEIFYRERRERKYLKPKDKPEATFTVESKDVRALIFCNIHGLWVSEANPKKSR